MTAPATLAERRAALKRLLASGESAIDAYERVLEGASEKDRRSLFKSVPFTRLIPPAVEWEWDAVPEDTVCMCAFLRAALAGSDDAGDDYGARWSGRRGGGPREGTDRGADCSRSQVWRGSRSGEWLDGGHRQPRRRCLLAHLPHHFGRAWSVPDLRALPGVLRAQDRSRASPHLG